MIQEEIWRPVTGYEDLYEVSNLGRVRSLDREVRVISPQGLEMTCVKKSRVLRTRQSPNGYVRVGLYDGVTPCKQKFYSLHRLVAHAFVPNPSGYPVVNHIDHNKANNAASNLEWTTDLENVRHCRRAYRHRTTRLTFELAEEIRKKAAEVRTRDLAQEYGVSQRSIRAIITKKNWKPECYAHAA
jgi:hypothetical protein